MLLVNPGGALRKHLVTLGTLRRPLDAIRKSLTYLLLKVILKWPS